MFIIILYFCWELGIMLHLATITGSMKMMAKEKKKKKILTDIDIRNPFNATALDIGGSMLFFLESGSMCQ